MIGWMILACEVAFWVLLGLGLLTRYGLHLRRVSAVLLVCVPLADLVLLGATVIDLRRGAEADVLHALAAVYVGFSVAYGHQIITGLDVRAAHRWAGGPAPVRPSRSGPAAVRYAWKQWRRALLGAAITVALLLGATALVGDVSRSRALLETAGVVAVVLVIELLGPLHRMLALRRTRTGGSRRPRRGNGRGVRQSASPGAGASAVRRPGGEGAPAGPPT